MYCSHCGAEVNEDSKFCSNCGTEIKKMKKEENLEDTQKIEMPPMDFVEEKFYSDGAYYDDSEEKRFVEKLKHTGKKSRGLLFIACGIFIGILVSTLILMSKGIILNSTSDTKVASNESAEVSSEQKDGEDSQKPAGDSSSDSEDAEIKGTEKDDNKDDKNNEDTVKDEGNPNNIPSDGQINYVPYTFSDGNMNFEFPSFFSIYDKGDNYVNLKTKNSDAEIKITRSYNLTTGNRNAKEKYDSTLDKLTLENAQIGFKNLSKRESVVTWIKDGVAYYQCNRFNKDGSKSDSMLISYPNNQEQYYYDMIQYIYDNFHTSSDLQ